MGAQKVGTVLYVKKYAECIAFYENILRLPILFQKNELTCFDLFGNHLIVEIDDRETYQFLDERHQKVFSCIRINVDTVKTYANLVKSNNIEIDYQENDWGTIAKFHDPDGNLIAFRDQASFRKQIKDHTKNRNG